MMKLFTKFFEMKAPDMVQDATLGSGELAKELPLLHAS